MQTGFYQLAPKYRRGAIYGLVGFLLLAVVYYGVNHVVKNDPLLKTVLGCAALVGISLAMIVPLRWALLVDESGIKRRWLFSWDFWSWEDFASGRIKKRHPFTFFDPQRFWWYRKLRIEYLDDSNLKELVQIINQHYHLPVLPPLPDSVKIKYGFRRTAIFDLQEIRLKVRGEPYHFAWQEVQRLHITRMDSLRRDFTSLELTLPGQEVELKLLNQEGGPFPSWNGAGAEELNEFLLAHVPVDRIEVDIYGERPARLVDVQKQWKTANKNERDFAIAMLVWLILLVGCMIWFAIENGILFALAMTFLVSPLYLVIWFFRREHRRKKHRIEKWLGEFSTLLAERDQIPRQTN